ncbi:NAD(P)-dependent glycerol-3-phosphate dehydrogenase [Candidatus Marinimicrobia bacterium]|nr:NAD(P)-dependent glycerol-3-phosphate dehydrogenase [Candidatus Neomarinimicrobiota bacterium]
MDPISFLGCGSWGGALGDVLARKGVPVMFWHRNPNIIDQIQKSRKHYLVEDLEFSKNVDFTNDIEYAINSSPIVVLAIPSQSIRKLLIENNSIFYNKKIIVTVSKGIEVDSLMTMSEVINDVYGKDYKKTVVLSGPSHAEEVVKKFPTTLVASSIDSSSSKTIQHLFSNEYLRTYLNTDVRGVEIGGALKNVMAIAAGICDGINYGDNSKAALMTRGMAEIIRLGKKMGAKGKTFQGLSGFGDLIVTCLSKHSRNRKVGQAIGEGESLLNIQKRMKMVAEGVLTTKSVHQLSLKFGLEMPIHEAMYEILFMGKNPKDSVSELMNRKLSNEHKK